MEAGVTYIKSYNAENRLSVVTKLLEGTCASPVKFDRQWDLSHDGDGTRAGTVLTTFDPDTQAITGTSVTSYFMAGLYEETVETSTVRKYYAISGMTVAMSDAEGVKYLLTDHLGSVTAITDADGDLLQQQRYKPFGQVRTNVPQPIPNSPITQTDFGYTGQRYLPSMGLLDYKARLYDSSIGRFIQPDTIIPNPADPQGWNRYGYVRNSPIMFVDPTGHWEDEGCGSGLTCELPETEEQLDLNDDDEEDVLNLGISLKMVTCDLLCQYATTFLGIAATGLDSWAFAINGGFAVSADLAWLLGPQGYAAVVGAYNLFSPIPNGIAIAGGVLWGLQGILKGENYLQLQASFGSSDGRARLRSLAFSLGFSQDTIYSAVSDGVGLLIREPNVAVVWSGLAVAYDIGRNPLSPVVSQQPAYIPTILQPQVNGSFNLVNQTGSIEFTTLGPLP